MNDSLTYIRLHTLRQGDDSYVRTIQINLEELRKLVGNPKELITLPEFTYFMIQGLEESLNDHPLVDVMEAATLVNSEHGISSEVGYEMINARNIVTECIREQQLDPDLKLDFTQQGDLFIITLTT